MEPVITCSVHALAHRVESVLVQHSATGLLSLASSRRKFGCGAYPILYQEGASPFGEALFFKPLRSCGLEISVPGGVCRRGSIQDRPTIDPHHFHSSYIHLM